MGNVERVLIRRTEKNGEFRLNIRGRLDVRRVVIERTEYELLLKREPFDGSRDSRAINIDGANYCYIRTRIDLNDLVDRELFLDKDDSDEDCLVFGVDD